jgi:hypothetical protein
MVPPGGPAPAKVVAAPIVTNGTANRTDRIEMRVFHFIVDILLWVTRDPGSPGFGIRPTRMASDG